MFTPSELEGEVDHSFFDSDTECPSITTHGADREAASTLLHEHNSSHPPAARHEGCVGRGGPGPGGTQVDHPRAELEKVSPASSSSIGYTSDTVSREVANTQVLSSDEKESDGEDGYYQSQGESEDEETQTRLSRKSASPKRPLRKRPTRSVSPSSTDTDTDSYTSSESSDEGSPREPSSALTRSRASKPLASSTRRGGELAAFTSSSSRSVDRPPTPTGESEDTATDVTPLSTPDLHSPGPGFDLAARVIMGVGKVTLEEEQPNRGGSSFASSDAPQEDQDFGSNLDELSLGVDSQLVAELLLRQQQQQQHPVRPGSRKNYSFSNDEVRRIDRENQRLLRELSRQSPRPRPASSAASTGGTGHPPAPVRVYHTALNRQRQQQRIERENLALLKRLEGVKASPGLRRTEQLADHQRQATYLGPSRPTSTTYATSFSASCTPLPRPALRTSRPPSRAVARGASSNPVEGHGGLQGRGLTKGHCAVSTGPSRTRTPERDRPSPTPTPTRVAKRSGPRPDWC